MSYAAASTPPPSQRNLFLRAKIAIAAIFGWQSDRTAPRLDPELFKDDEAFQNKYYPPPYNLGCQRYRPEIRQTRPPWKIKRWNPWVINLPGLRMGRAGVKQLARIRKG